MKVVALCMFAVTLVGNATGDLLPPERSYKILMLLPSASKSHKNVFMAYAETLADRGHKVGRCVWRNCIKSAINILILPH